MLAAHCDIGRASQVGAYAPSVRRPAGEFGVSASSGLRAPELRERRSVGTGFLKMTQYFVVFAWS